MPIYNKQKLSVKAKELGVVRDTYEKVCRLQEILRFLSQTDLLSSSLALKGGTAINLLFFNLPRLSVDIDLDFCRILSREKMLLEREKVDTQIAMYMQSQGYALSPHSKTPHSLDSFVYDYTNAGGMKDNIKLEINYSLRSHVLPVEQLGFSAEGFEADFKVTTVSPIEIYAAKTVALLTRAAARDLYDLNYMIRYGLFDEAQIEQYRQCVVFYLAIATKTPPKSLDLTAIESITQHKIHTDLYPVIRNKDIFELDAAKKSVKEFLKDNVFLTEKDKQFLEKFSRGIYEPSLIFSDSEIIGRVANHPMALWKTTRRKEPEQ